MIPPTRPAPTVTTSTFLFCAIVCSLLMPFFRHQLGQTLRSTLEVRVLDVVRGEEALGAGVADQFPADHIPVAAVQRVAKHPFDGVIPKLGKEGLPAWPLESG